MSAETDFLSKLLQTGDYATVDKLQINNAYFFGRYRNAFKWITGFKTKYAKTPSIKEFTKHFPNVELSLDEPLDEPMAYYCEEVRSKVKHNTLVDALSEVEEKLNEFQTDEAINVVAKTILKIQKSYIQRETKYLNESAEEWKKDYEEAEKSDGITGIRLGIEPFDRMTGGILTTDLVTFLGYTGVGKANPLSTPVLTPKGFIPMGEVKVGTKVIGEDGKPYDVSAIYPQGVIDVYEVTFQDGTKSRCSKEHLWKFKAKSSKHSEWQVDTLGNLMKYNLKLGKSWNLSIPVNKAVEFSIGEELPIDPYVLGILLGDGGFTTDRVTLTNSEKDIVAKCQSSLKDWGEFTLHSSQKFQHCFKGIDTRENKLRRTLKLLELIGNKSETKFIPISYLHSAIEERVQLLKGLMDTDGHVTSKGTYQFSTTSPVLKEDFKYLCRSLGYRCTELVDSRPEKGADCYRITILTDDIIVSSEKHLSRLSQVKQGNRIFSYDNLRIVDIQFVGQEECQCISVDSGDHTYICDDFIVTHNTWLIIIIACYLVAMGYKVLFITREMGTKQIMKRVFAVMNRLSYGRLKAGKLTREEKEKFFKFLDKMEKLQESDLVVELATGGVSNISSLADLHQPEVLIIDGGYLMTDDSDDREWKGLVETWWGFKQIALNRNLPTITTMQLKANKASLENIALARYINQYCDVIFGMEQDEQMFNDKELCLSPLKLRDAEMGGKFVINWDFTTMNWTPLYGKDIKARPVEEKDKNKKVQKIS